MPVSWSTASPATKVITVTGVVKEFQWVNPHTWLHITVDDGKGGKVVWVELPLAG